MSANRVSEQALTGGAGGELVLTNQDRSKYSLTPGASIYPPIPDTEEALRPPSSQGTRPFLPDNVLATSGKLYATYKFLLDNLFSGLVTARV